VENSTAGAVGLHSLRNTSYGGDRGDAVDSTYSRNDVKQVGFSRIRDLQGTGTTFFYPITDRSQQY